MLTGIDHIVIVVPDLERASDGYRSLGFSVVPGGRHPSLGTHNALVAFADGSYLELLAFTVASSPHRWFSILRAGGGLADFCAVTDDLGADVGRLRQAGVAVSEPFALGRERPDGYRLEWMMATPQDVSAGAIPFLIKDITPREERVPRQHAHPNGTAGIRCLSVAVSGAETARRMYAAVVSGATERCERLDLEANGFSAALGAHRVELLSPRSARSPLARWLDERGAGPFELTLAGGAAAPGLLDPVAAQGARIRIA